MNKKYFIRELRKGLPVTLSFLAISTLIYLVVIFSTTVRQYHSSFSPPTLTYLFFPMVAVIMAGVIAIILPCFRLGRYMSRRSADLYYSMPMKRGSMMLSDFLVTVLEFVIIYSVMYFLGYVAMAIKVAQYSYALVYLLPNFFLTLITLLIPLCISFFVFSRAERVLDGIFNIVLYNLALMIVLFAGMYVTAGGSSIMDTLVTASFTLSPALFINDIFVSLTCRYIDGSYLSYESSYIHAILTVFYLVVAAGAVLGTIFLPKKAENVGDTAKSYFGYRVILPIVSASLIIIGFALHYIAGICFIALVFGLYVFVNRGVKWSFVDYATFGSSIFVGIILGLIAGA